MIAATLLILAIDGATVEARGLPIDAVNAVVRAHKNEAISCYKREHAKQRGLSGRVLMRFVVGSDGRVASAKAEGNMKAVGACIRERLLSWEFPAPEDGGTAEVSFPFVFSAAD